MKCLHFYLLLLFSVGKGLRSGDGGSGSLGGMRLTSK